MMSNNKTKRKFARVINISLRRLHLAKNKLEPNLDTDDSSMEAIEEEILEIRKMFEKSLEKLQKIQKIKILENDSYNNDDPISLILVIALISAFFMFMSYFMCSCTECVNCLPYLDHNKSELYFVKPSWMKNMPNNFTTENASELSWRKLI